MHGMGDTHMELPLSGSLPINEYSFRPNVVLDFCVPQF